MASVNKVTLIGNLGKDPESGVKNCECCGMPFNRKAKDSNNQWRERAYCSLACSSKVKQTLPTHVYFWKYAKRGGDHECWGWQGITDQDGYGRVIFMTKAMKAHRVAYEMFNGPIDDGLVVMHLCDNPNCVNPSHLKAGTQKENMIDASQKNRLNSVSLLNLRPGAKGYHGASPIPRGEK